MPCVLLRSIFGPVQPRAIQSIAVAVALILTVGSARVTPANTLIFLNDTAGNLYSYAWDGTNLSSTATNYGDIDAWSISAGPEGNTIYFSELYVDPGETYEFYGRLSKFNYVTQQKSVAGGAYHDNVALGEGRDGFIYKGQNDWDGDSGFNPNIYRLDPTTGSETLIGFGGSGSLLFAGDIATDPTNIYNMYAAVQTNQVIATQRTINLVTLDRNTGGQTSIGSFGLTPGTNITGLGFSLDGELFATGPNAQENGGFIYRVNKTTGAATQLLTVGYNPADMATQPFTGTELSIVPEPSTYAMALAGIACGGFSMWRRRKRA